MENIIDERAIELLGKVFMVNESSAHDSWIMIQKVVHMCLEKHMRSYTMPDVERVKKMIVERLGRELQSPSFYDNFAGCSVQTCIVVLTRDVTMGYVRNAHYCRSTVADLFEAMNVDVTGAEHYLQGLDEKFTPSQKCVLRLLYGEGCSLAQAAGMLGVSQDEVRSLQWQAMEIFHREWLVLHAGQANQ